MRFTSKTVIKLVSVVSIVVIMSMSFPIKTVAQEVDFSSEGIVASGYTLSSDPFMIEWSLGTQKNSQTVALDETKSFTANISAYTAAADECGKSDGITASGKKVAENQTLACPKQYAMGTRIYIEGMGEYECQDRGGAIKGNRFDIYMETKTEAFTFGRQQLKAHVID